MKTKPSPRAYWVIALFGTAVVVLIEVLAQFKSPPVSDGGGIVGGVLMLVAIPLLLARFLSLHIAWVVLLMLGLGAAQGKLNLAKVTRSDAAPATGLTITPNDSVGSTPSLDVTGGREGWLDTDDGIGAYFPELPEKVEVASPDEQGHAWIATEVIDDGGVVYQISVVKIEGSLDESSHSNFLRAKADSFAKSLGVDPSQQALKWTPFGDGRARLNFSMPYVMRERNIRTEGFWIIDKQRVIKVSITYTDDVSQSELERARLFSRGFTLINTYR